MELRVEILAHFLSQENAQIVFPELDCCILDFQVPSGKKIRESRSNFTLQEGERVQFPSTSVPDTSGN